MSNTETSGKGDPRAALPIAWTVTSARTVDIDTARGPLTVTRGALLIAQQDIELGASDCARVRGRYPSGASGFVLLDESQVLTLSAALLHEVDARGNAVTA